MNSQILLLSNRSLTEDDVIETLQGLAHSIVAVDLRNNFTGITHCKETTAKNFLNHDELDENFTVMEILLPICCSCSFRDYCDSITFRNRTNSQYSRMQLHCTPQDRKKEVESIIHHIDDDLSYINDYVLQHETKTNALTKKDLNRTMTRLRDEVIVFMSRIQNYMFLLRNAYAFLRRCPIRSVYEREKTLVRDAIERCISIETGMLTFLGGCDWYFKHCTIYMKDSE